MRDDVTLLFARNTCLTVALALGLVIAARMLIGPFQLAGLPVNVPLNPEGLFGLSILCAVMLGPASVKRGGEMAATAAPTAKDSLSLLTQKENRQFHAGSFNFHPLLIVSAIGGICVLAYRTAINVPFVSDDFILIKMARNSSLASLRHAFTSAGGDGFYRPLGYASLAFDYLWAGINPQLWHASALAIHAMSSVLVWTLARRLGLSSMSAILAGSLFAFHGTHPEATVWIAGRFDLLATLFTLMGLALFVASLEDNQWTWKTAASLLSMTLALLSKESAYTFPLLLAVITVGKRETSLRDALWSKTVWIRVWPYFALTAVLFCWRAVLVGGIGGYRLAGTGESSFLSLKLGTTLKVLLVRLWTSLFFPINWSLEPPVWLALSCVAAIVALLWLGLKARPTTVFWASLFCLL
ncbi:MAG: hypothetical protein ABI824_19975, partial [Acidobacteriota bacterium]